MECYAAGHLREFAERYKAGASAYSYEAIVLALLTPLKRARARAA